MSKPFVLLIFLLVIVLLAIPLVSACGSPEPTQQSIKIGALVPLTGPYAMWGQMFMNAFNYALDEAGNKVAGKTIEFIVEDEGGEDVTMALDKAKKLVQADKVGVLMGPFYGGSAFSVMPYTSSVPIINVKWNECSQKQEELGNKYAFWVPLSYYDATYPLGLYAYDEMGIKSVTTIGSDYSVGYDFMQGFTDAFKSKGGQVVQQQWSPLTETDYAPYLSSLKTADAIALSTLGPPAHLALFPQFDQLGLFKKMKVLIAEPGTLPPPVMQELGDRLIGVIGTNKYLTTLDNAENKKFLPAYRAKYNEDPEDKTVMAYEGMRVVLAALEATGGDTNPDKLKQALLKVEMDLPGGHFKFSPGRVGIRDLFICKVDKVGGALTWVPVKTYPSVQPSVKTFP